MFECNGCKKQAGSGIRPRRVPVEVWEVDYLTILPGKHGNRQVKSTGTEIGKEALLCPDCPTPKPIVVAKRPETVINDLTEKEAA